RPAADRGHPHLAAPLDGRRPRHLHRRRAGPARRRQPVRGPSRALPEDPAGRARGRPSGPGGAARRAVRVQRHRRPRVLPRPALGAGQREAAHLVRALARTGQGGAGAGAQVTAPARASAASTARGDSTCSMTSTAVPTTPARAPSELVTIFRFRVVYGRLLW